MPDRPIDPVVDGYLQRIRQSTKELMEGHVDPIIAQLENKELPAPEREKLTEEAKGIVRRYVAAFMPNFITWLGQGLHAVTSAEAKYAFGSNIEAEVQDSRGQHQGMLFDFAQSMGALPNSKDFLEVDPDIRAVREHIKDFSPIKLTALAAALENTSIDFIPRLEKLATLIQPNVDITYTVAHGIADIEHAQEFSRALAAEMKRTPSASKDAPSTGTHVQKLLEAIFTPRQATR